jgi:gamma-glutamylaminecyclotransferase
MKVFVYGSLMSGQGNHRLLASARFVRAAHTEAAFTLVSLGAFPAMIAGGATSVRGELYEVDDATLAALDQLEGHPRFYRRELVSLRDDDRAFAYVLASGSDRRHDVIDSGDWRERCASR